MSKVPRALPQIPELPADEVARGLAVARQQRVAIFVVAYNAEANIESTLDRIPDDLLPLLECIFVIDDSSSDKTIEKARGMMAKIEKLRVFSTPINQGYGGNQKLGYEFSIRSGFDIVVLLHGDGQYAPEVLPRILAPFEDPDTAAVFGSRMMTKGAARGGGMPLYKRIGNRILTGIENRALGASLSEFHSGYRAYRVSALAALPFRYNTKDFHFDTEIIIQILGKKLTIVEVPIPCYYGDEICHVNGIGYAFQCLATITRALANRLFLVYHPKYDLEREGADYTFKQAPTSLHQFVLRQGVGTGRRVMEIGAGKGDVGRNLAEQGIQVVAVDQVRPDQEFPFPFLVHDLDTEFADAVSEAMGARPDVAIALDVIEHMKSPERGLREIHKALASGGVLMASTGNVAFILVRFMLFAGWFNYGKKGILDLTHTRLFTVRSFCRTLEGEGFAVKRVRGFGPPIADLVSSSLLGRVVDRVANWLARLWPSLFAYQFFVEAVRLDSVSDLLERSLADEESS